MDLSELPGHEGPARLRERHAPVAVFSLVPAFALTFELMMRSSQPPLELLANES
jgi:hypothetical protein